MQNEEQFGTVVKLKDGVVQEVKTFANYYFTFGFGQKHANGFHVIRAESYEKAREKMHERFGAKWAFQYTEDQWFNEEGVSQQEQFNLHEVV